MARLKVREDSAARVDYEQDFFAWTQEQARILRARGTRGLDWDNLAEEIESMGRRPARAGEPASPGPPSSPEVAGSTRATRSKLAQHADRTASPGGEAA
jgi:hypothetical protein